MAPLPTASDTEWGTRATSPQANTPATEVLLSASVRSWMPMGVSSSAQPIRSARAFDGEVRLAANRPANGSCRPSASTTSAWPAIRSMGTGSIATFRRSSFARVSAFTSTAPLTSSVTSPHSVSSSAWWSDSGLLPTMPMRPWFSS